MCSASISNVAARSWRIARDSREKRAARTEVLVLEVSGDGQSGTQPWIGLSRGWRTRFVTTSTAKQWPAARKALRRSARSIGSRRPPIASPYFDARRSDPSRGRIQTTRGRTGASVARQRRSRFRESSPSRNLPICGVYRPLLMFRKILQRHGAVFHKKTTFHCSVFRRFGSEGRLGIDDLGPRCEGP
jgi:hypothetical protein